MVEFVKHDGAICHDGVIKKTKQKLGFNEEREFSVWEKQVREKFIELLGIPAIEENACPIKISIVEEKQKEVYKQIRFEFESEWGAFVPCYLLIPDTGKEKYPVAIVLQGHNKSGFYSSIGEPYNEVDKAYDTGRGMFAVQAVEQGYIALAVEMRGRGDRTARNREDRRVTIYPLPGSCYYETMTALQLGRTMAVERAWDISRAIDALAYFPQCDTDKIIITGNSGGGTASFYAACYDERIKVSAPSCAFCPYPESTLRFYHCSCNYIPQIYRWFDMDDLSCLIAPRKLLIVAGEKDPSFLVEGVRRGYEKVEKIYEKAGIKDNCRLVVTDKGHFWDDGVMWQTIKEETDKMGW